MKLKNLLYMLLVLPFLWSCNEEDDVKEIFDSGTWYVLDYFGQANFDKATGRPKYTDMAHNDDPQVAADGRKNLAIIHQFSITFKEDGTFTGELQNGAIEGLWEADGDNHTFRIAFQRTPASTTLNKEFLEAMQEAVWYRGDSQGFLLLAPQDKKSFLQLTHNPEL